MDLEEANLIRKIIDTKIEKNRVENYSCFLVKVTDVDIEKQLVNIQIVNKSIYYDDLKRQYSKSEYPELLDIPILNNTLLRYKVNKDDIGLYIVLYSDSSLFFKGNVPCEVPNVVNELSSGVFLPFGFNPDDIYKLEDGVGLQINTGDDKITIDAKELIIEKDVEIKGNLTIKGDLKVEGKIEVAKDIKADGKIEATGDIESKGLIKTTGNVECADLKTSAINSLNIIFKTHVHPTTVSGAPTGPPLP